MDCSSDVTVCLVCGEDELADFQAHKTTDRITFCAKFSPRYEKSHALLSRSIATSQRLGKFRHATLVSKIKEYFRDV